MKAILAVDRGMSIGWADGHLPWVLKEDLANFKRLTMGATIVMGFNTWKSLNRPNGLPGRKNVILTRKHINEIASLHLPGDIDVISDLSSATRYENVWLCGGAQVYEQALNNGLIDELTVTIVDTVSGADVKLPVDLVAWKRWILTEEKQGRFWILDESYPLKKHQGEIIGATVMVFRRLKNIVIPTNSL